MQTAANGFRPASYSGGLQKWRPQAVKAGFDIIELHGAHGQEGPTVHEVFHQIPNQSMFVASAVENFPTQFAHLFPEGRIGEREGRIPVVV